MTQETGNNLSAFRALVLLTLAALSSLAAQTTAHAQTPTPTPVWTSSGTSISNINTGNVGIGTASPGFKLEIQGSPSRNTLGLIGDGDMVGYAGLRIGALTTTGIATNRSAGFHLHMRKDSWYGGDGSGPSFIIESFSKSGGFAAPFLITPTNDIILNGGAGASGLSYGKVGIGTTSPTEKLHVPARVRFGNILVGETRSGGAEPNGEAVESFGHLVLMSQPGYDIKFGNTGALPRMLLNSAGNVGIGTTSPGYKLDVSGSVNSTGLCLAGDCKTAWSQVGGGGGGQWTTSGVNISSANTGNVGVGVASPTAKLHVGGGARLDGAGRVYLGAYAPTGARGLEISEENPTTFSIRHHDPLVAWQNIAINPHGGKVGIGTISPLGPLSVGNSSVDTSDGYLVIGKKQGASSRHYRVGFDANFNFVIGDFGSNNVAGAWTSPFAINWQAPSSSLYINSAGNVGLGTTTPGARLDLGAGAAARGAYSDLLIGAGGNNPQMEFFGATKSSAITHDETMGGMVFYTNGPVFAPSFFVGNNGNVGVGTTSPGYKLDVAGSVNSTGLCLAGDCKTAWSQVGGGGASQWANGASSSINYVAGNVGIGTTTPIRGLQVSGPNGLGSSEFVLENTGMPANNRKLNLWGNAATGAAGRFFIRLLNDAGSAATRDFMSFDNATGNIGIGTSSPTQLLDVSGAGEVKTRAAGTISAAIQLSESNGTSTWSEWQQYFDRLRLNTHDGVTTRADVMSVLPNGNIGIGKANPTVALDVVGDIKATGSVSATYQDVAEWVPSTQRLRAGTVVVLDGERMNHVVASTSSYDTAVAGVVSESPGLILGVAGEDKVMVATTGRVKVKVDATRAPVKIGDLLVTSETPGVAMKSEPILVGGRRLHAPGTIVGKALEPLEKGVGEILVLLSLQ